MQPFLFEKDAMFFSCTRKKNSFFVIARSEATWQSPKIKLALVAKGTVYFSCFCKKRYQKKQTTLLVDGLSVTAGDGIVRTTRHEPPISLHQILQCSGG